MQPDMIKDLTSPFLANGIIGSICIALGWIAIKLWNTLESERKTHKVELAAKDALIKEIFEDRVTESKLGWEFAKDYRTQNDAFLLALRGKGQP